MGEHKEISGTESLHMQKYMKSHPHRENSLHRLRAANTTGHERASHMSVSFFGSVKHRYMFTNAS